MPAGVGKLPLQLTSFVGRRKEVRDLVRLSERHRLITLTGVAGVGKTRLAAHVAERLSTRFDGLGFVELAPVSDATLLPARVEAALALRGRRSASSVAAIAAAIGARPLLLVLDNCEHLIDACREVTAALLPSCPGLVVLATSREPLGVPGEETHAVMPLPLDDAVQLLLERTPATLVDARVAAAICSRLDQLPLGIELAAVRLRSMRAVDVLERLDSRFQLLAASGSFDGSRHLSLRAALDWSHDLVSQRERVLFRRLAVFAGPFRTVDAESICADARLERNEVAATLSRLVERSLVGYDGTHYQLLQTLRDYARDRLLDSGEHEVLILRHAEHYLELVETAPSAAPTLEAEIAVLAEAMLQEDNLRDALDWLHEHKPLDYVRMVAAVSMQWAYRGTAWEQARHLRRATAVTGTPPRLQAMLSIGLSAHAFLTGDYEAARRACEAGVAAARRLHDASLLADGLAWLGMVCIVAGEHDRAAAILDEARAAACAADDTGAVALTRLYQGLLSLLSGDVTSARGQLAAAEAGLRSGRRLFQLAQVLTELGRTETAVGDRADAQRHLVEALQLSRDLHSQLLSTLALEGFAALLAVQGRAEQALELAAAAAASRALLEITMPPAYQAVIDALLQPARERLGADRAERSWRRGSSMTVAAGIERALAAPPTAPVHAPPISRRQLEVARLVADGLSNREIAARLHLSVRTVEDHVQAVLDRLGFDRRSQIATYVTQRELAQIP